MFRPSFSRTRIVAILIVLAALVLFFNLAHAQKRPPEVPDNATVQSNGRSWKCNEGYRHVGRACNAVKIPQQAYLTSGLYGRGWECMPGYVQVGMKCVTFASPPNVHISSDGDGWLCERGFRAERGACVPITIAKNANLDRAGNDGECDLPYRKRLDVCIPPETVGHRH